MQSQAYCKRYSQSLSWMLGGLWGDGIIRLTKPAAEPSAASPPLRYSRNALHLPSFSRSRIRIRRLRVSSFTMTMRYGPDMEADANRALEVLQGGGIVIIPADVGYAIVTCDEDKLEKIFRTKGRAAHKRYVGSIR